MSLTRVHDPTLAVYVLVIRSRKNIAYADKWRSCANILRVLSALYILSYAHLVHPYFFLRVRSGGGCAHEHSKVKL